MKVSRPVFSWKGFDVFLPIIFPFPYFFPLSFPCIVNLCSCSSPFFLRYVYTCEAMTRENVSVLLSLNQFASLIPPEYSGRSLSFIVIQAA